MKNSEMSDKYNLAMEMLCADSSGHKELFELSAKYLNGTISDEAFDAVYESGSLEESAKMSVLGIAAGDALSGNLEFDSFIKVLDKIKGKMAYPLSFAVQQKIMENVGRKEYGAFFENMINLPAYFNENIEKYVWSADKYNLKKILEQWNKNKKIENILSNRDGITSYISFHDSVLFLFKIVREHDFASFMSSLSLFNNPLAVDSLSRFYSYENLEEILKVVRAAPVIINEENKWNGSIILPYYIKSFLTYLRECHRNANNPFFKNSVSPHTNDDLLAMLRKMLRVLLDREDKLFFIPYVLNEINHVLYTSRGKEDVLAAEFCKELIAEMDKRKISAADFFPDAENITDFISFVLLTKESEMKEDLVNKLYVIIKSGKRVYIPHQEELFVTNEHSILAQIFYMSDDPKVRWENIWVKFESERQLYWNMRAEVRSDSFFFVLMLGCCAVDGLYATGKDFSDLLDKVWSSVLGCYLQDRSYNDRFYKKIIAFLTGLYILKAKQDSDYTVIYEKTEDFIDNEEILFSMLLMIKNNDLAFDFIEKNVRDKIYIRMNEYKELLLARKKVFPVSEEYINTLKDLTEDIKNT